jgi:hypothetical protein
MDAALLRARYARRDTKALLARALERLERASLVAWLDARPSRSPGNGVRWVGAARGRDLFGGRRGTLAGEREEVRQLRMTARELRSRRRSVLAGSALPFVFPAHFLTPRAGGFDVIVANPPWIRLHRIPSTMRRAAP